MLDQPPPTTTKSAPAHGEREAAAALPTSAAQFARWREVRRQVLLIELYELEDQMLAAGQLDERTITRRRRTR